MAVLRRSKQSRANCVQISIRIAHMLSLVQSICPPLWAHIWIYLAVYSLSETQDLAHSAVISWLDISQLTLNQVVFTSQIELCSFFEILKVLVPFVQIIIPWLIAVQLCS